jgi:hypothetical protein
LIGLRRHEPLVAVDRLADLAELALELELGRRPHVRDRSSGTISRLE